MRNAQSSLCCLKTHFVGFSFDEEGGKAPSLSFGPFITTLVVFAFLLFFCLRDIWEAHAGLVQLCSSRTTMGIERCHFVVLLTL
jgi:hypothetical protein